MIKILIKNSLHLWELKNNFKEKSKNKTKRYKQKKTKEINGKGKMK